MNTALPFVVLVNDDPTQLSILSGLVRLMGLEPRAFPLAETALKAMTAAHAGTAGGASPALPVLIVTDLYMPGIDGWRFCRLLRSPDYAAFNHVPILVVSATFAGDEANRIATDLGAKAFLPAPIDGPSFTAQVRAILDGCSGSLPLRVLIVDDSTTLAGLIRKTFLAHGYQADLALTAREATAAFTNTTYDVAVLDYHLPDGSGDTLLDAFCAQQPDCVCLMMTNEAGQALALDWMKRGAAAYLRKPFDPGYLIELCARARRERALLRVQDLLELRTSELRESEARFRHAMAATRDGLWDWDVPSSHLYFSPAYLGMLGYASDELPFVLNTWIDLVHPEDRAPILASNQACLQNETQTTDIECRMRAKDGSWRWIHSRGQAVRRDAGGQALQITGTHVDITRRKLAEQERDALQAQLMQAQKMESVGRLAGGVAHDFNNLLQGMLNSVDLCRDELAPPHPAHAYLNQITHDACRSAELVSRLLAFARQQIIAPKVLDLNASITDTLSLLRRTLGEDIEMAWQPGHDAGTVNMDPVQLDQILTNLAVNARDAIDGTGKLTITTRSVTSDMDAGANHQGRGPGKYTLLMVSDTGCGMAQETQAHLFEPFFTTKGAGKGTGLGLATVYGIVKQNKGSIEVQSEPGAGTTFRIYLPQSSDAAPRPPESGIPAPLPVGRHETILLVEDEPTIRYTVRLILKKLGYSVLVAPTPEAALGLCREHSGTIHLLLSDVVMPGMDGCTLAAQLAVQRPAMQRLFMSGHTADVVARRGISDRSVNFLAKPFSRDALALKVRDVLDHAKGGAPCAS